MIRTGLNFVAIDAILLDALLADLTSIPTKPAHLKNPSYIPEDTISIMEDLRVTNSSWYCLR
jgi:hypothetical protein